MIKQFHANKARQKRHMRLRNHLAGTQERPRLSVFRSGSQIYAQVIDDTSGRTLAAASSLESTLKDFKPAPQATPVEKVEEPEVVEEVEVVTEAAPTKKGAKAEKASGKNKANPKAGTGKKTVLPTATKGEKKTPVEALAAISNNHKVALAREVGKLVGQRAKEKGIEQVVFDRGGYPYHGRVAALAEGAREMGLKF
jgi:ribosomal protein L18